MINTKVYFHDKISWCYYGEQTIQNVLKSVSARKNDIWKKKKFNTLEKKMNEKNKVENAENMFINC